MLIPTSDIKGWRDLQNKVATLFSEMGYHTESPYMVELAGRGKKEVDVYIRDDRASVNQVMLAECKLWSTRVTKDAVHSFHTVMVGSGANTGFIISKKGFQKGANEAAQSTNIHLLTWEQLQHTFGREWLSYQSERLERTVAQLRIIDNLHVDQFDPVTFNNNMFFTATGQSRELLDVLADIRMIMFASITQPESYDALGPIQVQANPDTPGATMDSYVLYVVTLPSVREFYTWIIPMAEQLVGKYNALFKRAHDSFESLPDDKSSSAMQESLDAMTEEMPVRVFRNVLGEERYAAVLEEFRKERVK